MLFNSPEFIFLFLPLAVMLHFALTRASVEAAIVGTTLSSLAFYAWWNPPYVLLLVASLAVNFTLAERIAKADRPPYPRIDITGKFPVCSGEACWCL